MLLWLCFSVMQPEAGMKQKMKFFYYSGSCHESSTARDTIRNNFVSVLNRVLQKLDGSQGCADPNNQRVCEAESVDIKCGKTQDVNSRRRRSTKVMFLINTLFYEINANFKNLR